MNVSVLLRVAGGKVWVLGVTQLHDVVYIVSYESPVIRRFNARTHQRLTDIKVMGFGGPQDIAACEQTSAVYVVCGLSSDSACVWRVSSDGEDVKSWLPSHHRASSNHSHSQ